MCKYNMEFFNILIDSLELRPMLLLIILLITTICIIIRQHHLPPGPWGLPLIGYALHIGFSRYRQNLPFHKYVNRFASKYGDIFSVNVFGYMFVFLNKYEDIKEAFQNPLLSDRPRNYLNEELNVQSGMLSASGATWKKQRQCVTSTLRKFGVRRLEETVSTESLALNIELAEHQTSPFDASHVINNSVSNIICSLLFGKRYEYTDAHFKNLLLMANENAKNAGAGALHYNTPFAKFVAPKVHKKLRNTVITVYKFWTETIESHVDAQGVDDQNNPIDFITAFASNGIDKDIQPMLASSLFAAGTETTSNTLRWCLMYMIEYPEIQSLVQVELDSIIGRDRLPDLKDMAQLPYTHAVLYEVQRIATIIPLGGPHYAHDTTYIKNFKIPKGSYVISNLWGLHNDPTLWKEPESFRPSRFLDESGNLRQRRELIPFSIGRRVCVGENLAKMELSIFFTHMLHRFTFTKPKDGAPLSFDGVVGLTNAPKPFKVVITARN